MLLGLVVGQGRGLGGGGPQGGLGVQPDRLVEPRHAEGQAARPVVVVLVAERVAVAVRDEVALRRHERRG